LIGKLEHHFIDEERIVFPELDKLPRKQPLSLAHLEHDDLKRIQQIATLNIERVVKYQGEQGIVPAANTSCILIKFIKRHFMLEEEVIFPLIPSLREEQQQKILLALEKAEKGARP
jgi:hemerythrin-like domain-containing protein